MISYAEFLSRTSLSKEELIACSQGTLVADPPPQFARLPAPPMLMFDRIVEVQRQGGRGRIVAEQDVRFDDWFFHCHFRGDPVQPGCLGVDAVWQLLGFFCTLSGAPGTGRALGCKEVEFSGQIRPFNKLVRYECEVRRYTVLPSSGCALIIGSARVLVDGEAIYAIKDAKVGTFMDIAYPDYPNRSKNSVGGLMIREEAS